MQWNAKNFRFFESCDVIKTTSSQLCNIELNRRLLLFSLISSSFCKSLMDAGLQYLILRRYPFWITWRIWLGGFSLRLSWISDCSLWVPEELDCPFWMIRASGCSFWTDWGLSCFLWVDWMLNCLFSSIEQLNCPFQISGELNFSLWADWIPGCSLWVDWMSNCLFGSIRWLDCPFQMSGELSFSLWADWVLGCSLWAGWTVARLELSLEDWFSWSSSSQTCWDSLEDRNASSSQVVPDIVTEVWQQWVRQKGKNMMRVLDPKLALMAWQHNQRRPKMMRYWFKLMT